MKKVKIIGRDNVGWSIDKDHENMAYFLSKLEGIEITDNYISADVYLFVWHDLVLSPRYFGVRVLKWFFHILKKPKKIVTWITNDITQSNSFLSKSWPVDVWISPSAKVSDFLQKNKFVYVTIPFFVSPAKFKKLSDDRKVIAEKLGITFSKIQGRVLIGSFQRDSLGSNLNQPKWQKNPDLLIKICKKFPAEKYVLVLAGPRRHYLVDRCIMESIPYIFVGDKEIIKRGADDIFVNNTSEEDINLLYNMIDMYIVTSKSEGGPKAILESSLAKTLVCSTDVGFAKDFLHPSLLYSEEKIDVVVSLFNKIKEEEDLPTLTEYRNYNYSRVTGVLEENHYLSLLKKLLSYI